MNESHPSTPLRVLMVEDSEDDARLLARELNRGGYDVSRERVDTEGGLRKALAEGGWEVILCDFAFPHFSGEAALKIVRESGLDMPFIYVSGTIGEEVAVEAMRSGAHDYVMKGNLARLAPAVARELHEAVERREYRRAEEAMRVSEFKYRHLFENMSEAALLIEEGRERIIDTNRQAEALLGRTRTELLGMHLDTLFRGDDFCRGGKAEALRRDGTEIPIHVGVSEIELYGRKCCLALFRSNGEAKHLD